MNFHKQLIVDLTQMPATGTVESQDNPKWLSVSCCNTHGYIKVTALENEIYEKKVEGSEESDDQNKPNFPLIQSLIFRPDSRFYFEKNENQLTNQIIFPTSSCGSFTYRVSKVGLTGNYVYFHPRSLIVIAQNNILESGKVFLVYNHKFDDNDKIWLTQKEEIDLGANESAVFTFQFKTPN